jgi:hypothetical protein
MINIVLCRRPIKLGACFGLMTRTDVAEAKLLNWQHHQGLPLSPPTLGWVRLHARDAHLDRRLETRVCVLVVDGVHVQFGCITRGHNLSHGVTLDMASHGCVVLFKALSSSCPATPGT